MRWHWQNLSDEPGHERHGFWHGRAWLQPREDSRIGFRVEWSHGKAKAAWTLDLDRSEREVMLHVALPGFSYFVSVVGVPARLFDALPMKMGATYGGWSRTIGLRVFDRAVWWSVWEDDMCWSSKDPWWMRGRFGLDDVANFLFGKTKYETRELERREVTVPMPEKSYPATAIRELATWTRRRWPWAPFSKRRMTVQIEVPGGIGIPGKGENDYDCGPDAIYSQSSASKTIEDGIGSLIASALRTRLRRGGSHMAVE